MTEWSTNSIRLLDIRYGTSVDGIGLRTSLYCAGCEHHCVGCHNPQSWDEQGGEAVAIETLFHLIVEADMNVTFTGGDPMLHPEASHSWHGSSRARLIRASGATPVTALSSCCFTPLEGRWCSYVT